LFERGPLQCGRPSGLIDRLRRVFLRRKKRLDYLGGARLIMVPRTNCLPSSFGMPMHHARLRQEAGENDSDLHQGGIAVRGTCLPQASLGSIAQTTMIAVASVCLALPNV